MIQQINESEKNRIRNLHREHFILNEQPTVEDFEGLAPKKLVLPEIKGLEKQTKEIVTKRGPQQTITYSLMGYKDSLFEITVRPYKFDDRYEVFAFTTTDQLYPLVQEILPLLKKETNIIKPQGQKGKVLGLFDVEQLNKVMKTLSSSVPSLLTKYNVKKLLRQDKKQTKKK